MLLGMPRQHQSYDMYARLQPRTYVVGIVGSEAAKFTAVTEFEAKKIIRSILMRPEVTGVSSGACHLGGIDIWAEEIGRELGLKLHIFPSTKHQWEPNGYMERNLKIVEASNEVHCITVKVLPDKYRGMRWEACYHCRERIADHVKSGGCWTAWQAYKRGKAAQWHIL